MCDVSAAARCSGDVVDWVRRVRWRNAVCRMWGRVSGTLVGTSKTVASGLCCFFFQAEDGIRDYKVTGVQTCALPISLPRRHTPDGRALRAALLLPGRALLLAAEHRALAGHRRHGARRLLGACHRGRADRKSVV